MAIQLAVLSEWHIILALIIVFLLFGGKKLPELARGIGEAMKEFKKASRDIQDDTPPAPSKPAAPTATSAPQKTDEGHNKSA
ncbi:MAG: twin-arginine translocase TatA/TatE family subunit [Verrucomicrobiia bacterium]